VSCQLSQGTNPLHCIPQCKNCLKYNHTKNYCHLDPKCVLCAGDHTLTDCPQRLLPQKDMPKPKCSNCGEDHLASYRGCKEHQKLVQKLHSKTVTQNKSLIAKSQPEYGPAPIPPINAWFNKNGQPTQPKIERHNTAEPTISLTILDQLKPVLAEIINKFIQAIIPTIIQTLSNSFSQITHKLP